MSVKNNHFQGILYNQFLWIFIILIITLIVYTPTFQNDFLKTWDDDRYIIENPLIKSTGINGLIEIFTNHYDGHYHPLTLVSLSMDYQLGELNPITYHTTNLILHLLNTLLVFIFIHYLFRKGKLRIAILTSLLFGIATMNVESVAWASERKNLLYALFYWSALIAYLKYIQYAKTKFYILAILLFVFSSLSKAMAIPLFFSLPVIDYFYGRKLLSKKVILEKLPFFTIATGIGILAIIAQQSTWGEGLSQQHYPIYQRAFFAGFAYIQYIIKLIIPYQLSGLYPYPVKLDVNTLLQYTGSLLLIFGIIYMFIRKFNKHKVFTFSFLFFSVNIFLLLKFFEIPAGDYIMADRYNYVAEAGVFLFAGFGLDYLLNRFIKFKFLILTILIIYLGTISFFTYQRVKVWKNDLDFYTNIINNQPDAQVAFLNRGGIRKDMGNLSGALADFNKAIKLSPNDYKANSNRGAVYSDMGKHAKALGDYQKANKLKPNNPVILSNLGYAQLKTGDFKSAVNTLSKSLQLQNNNVEAITNRGTAKYNLGDLQGAITDYRMAIEIDSSYENAYYNQGLALLNLGEPGQAISSFEKAIDLKPDYAEAYANKAIAWSRMGNIKNALIAYNKALELNPSNYEVYLNRGIDLYFNNDLSNALIDINKAIELNPNLGASYYFRAMILLKSENPDICNDLQIAVNLGFSRASSELKKHCK